MSERRIGAYFIDPGTGLMVQAPLSEWSTEISNGIGFLSSMCTLWREGVPEAPLYLTPAPDLTGLWVRTGERQEMLSLTVLCGQSSLPVY